jgi:hypothetical protein
MDYSIILIFSLVILTFAYQVYYTYFSRGNKISDEQLIKNYISWKMKKDNAHLFPSMHISPDAVEREQIRFNVRQECKGYSYRSHSLK